jgi:RimJ/RimL family protein N-acetyltransferase
MTNEELTQLILSTPRTFETNRTRLETPSLAQVPARMAWAEAAHDQLQFTYWWRKSVAKDVAERSAQSEINAVNAGSEIIYNVFEKATNAYVGRIDLHSFDADAPRCEIGYMADPRTQGRGLLREAAQACVALCVSHRLRARASDHRSAQRALYRIRKSTRHARRRRAAKLRATQWRALRPGNTCNHS